MPTINPSLVPTIAPGNLFTALTADATLNVRWITPTDPVYYEAINRPLADITLRQLILAKTLDMLSVSIGHEAIFPFLIQAKVINSTTNAQLPNGWIWDLHMSTPSKWQDFRLAEIKRLSGTNPGSTGVYTGVLRLIFTATKIDSTIETAIFFADYSIESPLTYQRTRLTVCTPIEEPIIPVINSGESETIKGFITFRTLPQDDPLVQAFYDLVSPIGVLPITYQIANTGATPTEMNSYSSVAVSHGTGMLVDSCNNAIPSIASDASSWLGAFNYPFDADASKTSHGTFIVTIPAGIFREFNIVAPAGDEPTGDTSGTYFPVWISRIQPESSNQLRFYFATHNVTRLNPSPDPIEFARLDLLRNMITGDIVAIEPIDDLLLHVGTDDELYYQDFGRGHVVLSSEWGPTSTTIDTFFDTFGVLLPGQSATFLQTATRLSSFGISRVPRFTPTDGQCRAMIGTTASLTSPIPPSETNRFVTELDQGLGNTIDLDSQPGIIPVNGISRYGNTGGLVRRTVQLCIDYTKLPTDSTSADAFYVDYVLPRLTILLGRSPIWGDEWYNGTTFLRFNSDTWQSI